MVRAPKKLPAIIDEGHVVRKNNDEIGYRIKSGSLSLLSRKFLNILIWHAQDLKDQEDDHGRWKLPVSKLIRNANFNSRDYSLLRNALDELQETRVIRPARGGGVTCEVLIPSFTLDNVEHSGNEQLKPGQKKRGGELWLWYMLPPELKSQLLDPNQYTRLPIAIMAALRSVPALALYEICRRYVTNPGGVTNRDDWQNWWRILTGATLDAEPPEYKYAKRDVFKRGIDEINSVTDIEVDLLEYKVGKFVKQIQFSVRAKKQGNLDMGPPPVDTGILSKLTEIGLTLPEAERLASKHSEKDLLATLDLVRERAANSSLPALASPAAFFKAALRDCYVATKKTKPKQVVATVKQGAEAEDPARKAAREAAIAEFNALPGEKQRELLDAFAATLKGPPLKAFQKSGLDHPLTGNAFVGWMLNNRRS
ncbi:replication initiation protein [Sulfuricystis multivorans]|uniref:replication initiation protein n=1 Tax=Sulfuricystis multivorans TaxID=2211108 RepID=UPI000F841C39|nr:replication initiation protein [Sulfuricystis multivorans]